MIWQQRYSLPLPAECRSSYVLQSAAMQSLVAGGLSWTWPAVTICLSAGIPPAFYDGGRDAPAPSQTITAWEEIVGWRRAVLFMILAALSGGVAAATAAPQD